MRRSISPPMQLWPQPPGLLARACGGLVTLAVLAGAGAGLWALARWAVVDATWSGGSYAACAPAGACWAFVGRRLGQFVYGFYPGAERWRVDVVAGLLVAGMAALLAPRAAGRPRLALAMLTLFPLASAWLLLGGAGLAPVPTRLWGGLMLTGVIGVVGLVVSVPLGIALALARRSRRRGVSLLAGAFVEFWRGVPLIAVLFLALIMLPAILPAGGWSDPLALSLIAISVFTSAYMAEVVRGGLQALPPGQGEAARALGLKPWQASVAVELPQALRIALPGMVNVAIALFKDTTLVMIVGLFDLMSIARATVSDPAWLGLSAEAYLFAGLVFWTICFGLSVVSRRLERRGAW